MKWVAKRNWFPNATTHATRKIYIFQQWFQLKKTEKKTEKIMQITKMHIVKDVDKRYKQIIFLNDS